MYRIVQKVEKRDLLAARETGMIPVSVQQDKYLRLYNPYGYQTADAGEDEEKGSIQDELALRIYDIVVKLDPSVIHGSHHPELAREKACMINPILDNIGINKVTVRPDHMKTIYEIKYKGLEALAKLYENMDLSTSPRDTDPSYADEHHAIVQKIMSIFGDVPILLFGSRKTDYDTKVYPENMTLSTYRSLEDQHYTVGDRDLEMIIVPRRFGRAFEYSDAAANASRDTTRLINGHIEFPVIEEERLKQLKLVRIGISLLDLRYRLTEQGFNECLGNPRRIRSKCKAPHFAAKYLEPILMKDVGPGSKVSYSNPTTDAEVFDMLVEANLSFDAVLDEYLKICDLGF